MKHKKLHFHFIGIGGIGMSGIASLLKKDGHTISGCDSNIHQKSISLLEQEQCRVFQGNNSEQCSNELCDVIVYSTAVSKHHPEILWAQKNGLLTLHRSEVLAKIMDDKISIAITGSHGKTTTSSLISHIFIEADTDPTLVIGGHLNSIKSNARYGKGNHIIIEADESDRSFLNFFPTCAVITNIDLEHLETYKDISDIITTFSTFISHVPCNGYVIVNGDDNNIHKALGYVSDKTVVTFGQSEQVDWKIHKVTLSPASSTYYLQHGNKVFGPLTLSMPGIHNIFNSTAAFVTAYTLGINEQTIIHAIASFSGVDRRFTFKGTYQGADIFDDYGHHPLEIKHTLAVARKQTKNKLIVLFQPHRYTRTAHLWNDFIQTFAEGNIDSLIITDIYASSEQPIDGILSQKLVEDLKKKAPHLKVIYLPFQENFNSIALYLKDEVSHGDTLLLQGAGKMNLIQDKLI